MFTESITPTEFCYALQGFVELQATVPTEEEFGRIISLLDTVDVSLEDDIDYMDCAMMPIQFVVWLSGYTQIADLPYNDEGKWNEAKDRVWSSIKDHLVLVFMKVTPDRTSEIVDDSTVVVDERKEDHKTKLTKEDIERMIAEKTKDVILRPIVTCSDRPRLIC